MTSKRFIITVIGIDKVGIVAHITNVMSKFNVNIVDISQTIMEDLFTMIMLTESKEKGFDLVGFQNAINAAGDELGVEIQVQKEDVFRFMHRI
ncbi:MAG: ACT domain-containing protein [Methanohalophilus sp. T328-1]|jgi:ACT domain-containing protein|nr:MAG: ACT domain-containing protein [Methanohalophilus sp. T328-1]